MEEETYTYTNIYVCIHIVVQKLVCVELKNLIIN